MLKDVGLKANPLDFNPPPEVAQTRAQARYARLLEMEAAGQEVSKEELDKYRIAAYGRVDSDA